MFGLCEEKRDAFLQTLLLMNFTKGLEATAQLQCCSMRDGAAKLEDDARLLSDRRRRDAGCRDCRRGSV